MGYPKGRAVTVAQKHEIIERLLLAWIAQPEQRLGQLIVNATYKGRNTSDINRLQMTEDDSLIDDVEYFASSALKNAGRK